MTDARDGDWGGHNIAKDFKQLEKHQKTFKTIQNNSKKCVFSIFVLRKGTFTDAGLWGGVQIQMNKNKQYSFNYILHYHLSLYFI